MFRAHTYSSAGAIFDITEETYFRLVSPSFERGAPFSLNDYGLA